MQEIVSGIYAIRHLLHGLLHIVIDLIKKERKCFIMVIKYYNKNELCSEIAVDEKKKTVSVCNYTQELNKRAFGVNETPSWHDLEYFLESRCFPRDRQHLKMELKQLGLTEYNPLDICRMTMGRNYKDEQWLTIDDEREVEHDDDCERC